MSVLEGAARVLTKSAKHRWSHKLVQRATSKVAGELAAVSVMLLHEKGEDATPDDAVPVVTDIVIGTYVVVSERILSAVWKR